MRTADELTNAVRVWVGSSSEARQAANWLLDRAANDGQIPKCLTLDPDVSWRDTLIAFFSSAYVRVSQHGRRLTLHFERWENDYLGESGGLLPILAAACDRELSNRRQGRRERVKLLTETLQRFLPENGFPAFVAKRQLERVVEQTGRFWNRGKEWDVARTELEVTRYFNLLRYVEALRNSPARVERAVHVSRIVAGDTHWFRPGNQNWRDLADDLLAFNTIVGDLSAPSLEGAESRTRILADAGIVENLTSVTVLVYGAFSFRRRGTEYRWPAEAATQSLPIWLSALHLQDAEIVTDGQILQVVSIENETSFLDRIEQLGDDRETILVYTQGQANRAVIALLRLISRAAVGARFSHEGDLDLAGVRILSSLASRSGLVIEPRNMDEGVHRRYEASGIPISEAECDEIRRSLMNSDLPCRDLLVRILEARKRIEQESITADASRSGGDGAASNSVK